MTFNANANSITIDNGTQTIFSTSRRMPHLISSISGTFSSIDATINQSGGMSLNSSVDTYVGSGANYTFSNSFVWAYVKVTANANRTDLAIDNPIFMSGSTMVRIYIGSNSYLGAYIITPMAFNGAVGFRQEWSYNLPGQASVPGGLYPTNPPANNNGNLGLTFSYTLYYGRFI